MKQTRKKMRTRLLALLFALMFSVAAFPAMQANAYGVTSKSNGKWHKDKNGWYFSYGKGKYEKNRWQVIDNNIYYFGADGYMRKSEWVQGVWISKTGSAGLMIDSTNRDISLSMIEKYRGAWKTNKYGVYYQWGSNVYKNTRAKIDGVYYWFDKNGYVYAHAYNSAKKNNHGRTAYKVVAVKKKQVGGIYPVPTVNNKVAWGKNDTKKAKWIVYNSPALKLP